MKLTTLFFLLFNISINGIAQTITDKSEDTLSVNWYEWKNGEGNAKILIISHALKEKGYDLGPECNLGGVSGLRAALTKFQADNQLTSGRLDMRTLVALGIDFYLPIDEKLGTPQFRATLIQFQREKKLIEGRVDTATLNELGLCPEDFWNLY